MTKGGGRLIQSLRALATIGCLLWEQNGWWVPGYFSGIKMIVADYLKLRASRNARFLLSPLYMMPYTKDATRSTPLDAVYFYQDTWAARKIFTSQPLRHFDIGSSAKTVGIISQFVPTTMIDIRPVELQLEGLEFRQGSILAIPAEDKSIESLSSLCVVEHIGLGRYGDDIDAFGSEKAAAELQRVLAVGGNLYFSVPVDSECRVYFNAHRAFTRDTVIGLFPELTLMEERYQYGTSLTKAYVPEKGFGTGLFHFRRLA